MDVHSLDLVLDEIIARWGIPGLAVGIVDRSDLIYTRTSGVQSLFTQSPVASTSIFCVASISKCFVATAVMRLAEQGLIDLDAPVVRYLPYFHLNDIRSGQITVRSILSHTSGIPDMDETEYDEFVSHPEFDDGASERYVRGLCRRGMVSNPGEHFLYSNIGYNVLGDLISKVSGAPFEEYMNQNILHPAGMDDSTFYFPEVAGERLAVPHLRTPEMAVNPVYPYHRADAPASSLHSTLQDMCNWCITSLDQGTFRGQHILSEDQYRVMWTPVAPRNYPPFYEHTGLGWTLGHYGGLQTVSHGGRGFGWTDFLILLPEIRRGAVILSNEESSARESIVTAVVDIMLERIPEAGPVSWMIPISRALHTGGLRAAHDLCGEIIRIGGEGFLYKPGELISLAYQLVSAQKILLAIEVLRLNLEAFPDHQGTRQLLDRLEYIIEAPNRGS